MTKKLYSTPEIEVSWEPDLCHHAAECVRGAPRVFNPRRKPWVELQHEPAEKILEVVSRCPSGALKARRLAAGETGRNVEGPDERVGGPADRQTVRQRDSGPIGGMELATRPVITASKNGPLLVTFACIVQDAEGNILREAEKVALCRCGQSKTKPFCDGSHRAAGFEG
jgi:uncharacterized Fe-S cluster protein YjdI